MKKLDLSAVTTSIGFPVKHGTMDHIQSAYQEALAALAQSAIGSSYDATKVYILYGCVATGTDPGARTFTAGAVFYNGEVYLVDAATFTSTGGNVAIGTITTTYFTGNGTDADPVIFTDATPRYVHQIRKIVISAGTSVGALDFSNWIDVNSLHIITTTSGSSITLGTATISVLSMLYKIHGGMVTISFTLSIAVTAYSSNYLSVKIPLPIAADVSVGFGWYSVFNYTPNSAAYAIGEASILYTAPTFLQLTVANQTSTGTAFIHGEITYKI